MLLMIGCFSWKDGWNFKNNFEIIFRHDVKATTNDEKRECNAAVVCYSIKKFNHKIKDFIKVKDHCHYTLKYKKVLLIYHINCNAKNIAISQY